MTGKVGAVDIWFVCNDNQLLSARRNSI